MTTEIASKRKREELPAVAAAAIEPPLKKKSSFLVQSPIYFYDVKKPFGELSNFWKLEKPLECAPDTTITTIKTYATSEHLYQSLKYLRSDAPDVSREFAEEIRIASTPNKAKLLAHQCTDGKHVWQRQLAAIVRKYQKRGLVKPLPESEYNQLVRMRLVLRTKFLQDSHCRKVLLSTGNRLLIEHTLKDIFWGGGFSGFGGKNWLGKLLMELREEYKRAT